MSFYYYYYPAGMTLSLALACVFHHFERPDPVRSNRSRWSQFLVNEGARWGFLLVAAAMFVYFFPILAALKIPADGFRKWAWFNSWI